MGTTTIEVKDGTWARLNSRKSPGQSFDDVLQNLLRDPAPDQPAGADEPQDCWICPGCGFGTDTIGPDGDLSCPQCGIGMNPPEVDDVE